MLTTPSHLRRAACAAVTRGAEDEPGFSWSEWATGPQWLRRSQARGGRESGNGAASPIPSNNMTAGAWRFSFPRSSFRVHRQSSLAVVLFGYPGNFFLTFGWPSLFFVRVSRFTLPVRTREQWLSRLLERFVVYVPSVKQDRVHWHRFAPTDLGQKDDTLTPALVRIRAAEPVKSFMFQPRQQVAAMPAEEKPAEEKPRLLIGAKSCDLVPLKVHDRILGEGQFTDPFYNAQRRRTMVIAADCPTPEESCFCNLLGGQPFARDGADVTLAVVDNCYLLESQTPEGEELLNADSSLLQPATEAQLTARENSRKAAVEALTRTNPKPLPNELPRAVAAKLHDETFWSRHAATCVECYGCLMGCPTCYCFLLYDKAKENGLERTRVWDACYEAAYARVGGGANPRAEFLLRFANRFDCKFSQFKNDHGFYSCSGCGRCFQACMGKIDIRKVLAEL